MYFYLLNLLAPNNIVRVIDPASSSFFFRHSSCLRCFSDLTCKATQQDATRQTWNTIWNTNTAYHNMPVTYDTTQQCQITGAGQLGVRRRLVRGQAARLRHPLRQGDHHGRQAQRNERVVVTHAGTGRRRLSNQCRREYDGFRLSGDLSNSEECAKPDGMSGSSRRPLGLAVGSRANVVENVMATLRGACRTARSESGRDTPLLERHLSNLCQDFSLQGFVEE